MAVRIPEKYFPTFFAVGQAQRLPAGATVFMQGDPASNIYLIAKGRVRAFATSPSGRETTLEVLERGRLFGDSSFLSGTYRSVSIQTVTDSEIVAAATDKLFSVCQSSDELTKFIFQHMADTCNYLTHQITRLVHYNSVQRVADFLLCESERRKSSLLPYTHEEIANSVSLNRVTVSRILSDFKAHGWIESRYGSISIADRAQLSALLP